MASKEEMLLWSLPRVIEEADEVWQRLGPRNIDQRSLINAYMVLRRNNPNLYVNLPDWIHEWTEEAAEVMRDDVPEDFIELDDQTCK